MSSAAGGGAYRLQRRFSIEPLTDALARWKAALWLPSADSAQGVPMIVYIDGHRQPIYTQRCIPRGLIGRSGKILGWRALVIFGRYENPLDKAIFA